jgi:hypothetical protein
MDCKVCLNKIISMNFTLIFVTSVGLLNLWGCAANQPASTDADKTEITAMLDSFHAAAARADYKGYFDFFAEGGTFIGTDATEYWDKQAFMQWSKPYFDKGKAWSFTAVDRHIYMDNSGKLAWFDELLNTQMKICRGSGVVEKQGGRWKVQQYVLSITMPNSKIDTAVALKASEEDSLLNVLTKYPK